MTSSILSADKVSPEPVSLSSEVVCILVYPGRVDLFSCPLKNNERIRMGLLREPLNPVKFQGWYDPDP